MKTGGIRRHEAHPTHGSGSIIVVKCSIDECSCQGIMFNIREGEDTWDYDYGYDEATANTVVLFLERIEKKVVLEAGK